MGGGEGGGAGGGQLNDFYSQPTSPWVPILLLIQKYIKIRFSIKAPNSYKTAKPKHKNQNHFDKQRRVLIPYSIVYQSK